MAHNLEDAHVFQAIAAARIVGGQYPERPEEPVCQVSRCLHSAMLGNGKHGDFNCLSGISFIVLVQYFLKTGTCKFGATCKFNHPRNAGGSLAKAPLNYHGYPLRPVRT